MTAAGPRAKDCAHVWFHWHSWICRDAGYANGLADARAEVVTELAEVEAAIARVQAVLDEWDRVSKGESPTTARIRAAIAADEQEPPC